MSTKNEEVEPNREEKKTHTQTEEEMIEEYV